MNQMEDNKGRVFFENRIEQARLTKNGRKIATFYLDNLLRAGFMTSLEIAHELNMSDTSIIRFARSLGYSGFAEMKRDLQSHMANRIDEYSQVLLAQPAHILQAKIAGSDDSDLVRLAIDNELKHLDAFATRYTEDSFSEIADAIIASRRKCVLSLRGSAAMAFSFGIRLRYLVDDVHTIVSADPNDMAPIYTMGKDDCLIVFGFINYATAILEALKLAKKRGSKIICVTDRETSPLVRGADYTLICNVDGISFSSYTLPLLATEIIAASMAKKLGNHTEERNFDLVEYMHHRRYFVSST